MKNFFLATLATLLLFSCSHKKQLTYLNGIPKGSIEKIDLYYENNIEIGDVLKIDINTVIPEASTPYITTDKIKSNVNADLLIVDGFLVNKDSTIKASLLIPEVIVDSLYLI